MRRLIALLALAGALRPVAAAAQEVSAGALFQAYSVSGSDDLRLRSIRLLTFPFSARVMVSPSMSLSVRGAYADAAATLTNAVEAHARGFVDTRLSVELRTEGLLLAGSALLPTGDVVGSSEEATLVGLLSTDLMPFAITQWGTGGGFAGDVGYAFRPGTLSVQLSVGASYLSESSPLAGGPMTYQPGREVRTRATIEAPAGDAGVVSFLVGYQEFAVDTYGEFEVFTPGSRLEGMASYALPFGARESALAYVGIYRLGEGAPGGTTGTNPALAGVGVHAARTLLLAGTEMRFMRDGYDIVPRGELRVVRSADGLGQGWLASVGGRTTLRSPGPLPDWNLLLEPTVALRFGRLVAAQDVAAWVLGWEASVAVRWGDR